MCFSLVSCSFKKQTGEPAEDVSAKPVAEIDAAEAYDDVKKGDWFEESVTWAVNEGISEPAKPTTFGVNDSMSKQDIILYLWKAAGSPGAVVSAKTVPASDPDSDINKAIDWALEEGVVESKAECKSTDIASRLDAIEFMWNEADKPEVTGVVEFDDAKGISSVNWARSKFITFGTGNNKFSPDMDCSKSHIVTFLFRAK